jgi:hypothetical protein
MVVTICVDKKQSGDEARDQADERFGEHITMGGVLHRSFPMLFWLGLEHLWSP